MKPKRLFCILLSAWVLLDMLVAMFTTVHADEAYYALYGQFLDWGYYDHPPMVALLTFFSSLLFDGNLSIRFLTVLLHGGTVWLIWNLLPEEKWTRRGVTDFFIIAGSLFMFSVYGIVTTPDAPLLFFTALFFFFYKKYLSNNSWPNALLMGVALAAMLYSKYMAVLVVAFVVISNWRVLKDPKIWVAGLLAAALFVPHILWQFQNEFPSLRYHLVARNSAFSLRFPLEFIPNQLVIFNPVCFCLALYFCWKNRKTENLFLRACLFTIAGFVLFFWMMTFKGHAEPHWTVAASVPLVVLLFVSMRDDSWQKWICRGILPFALLLLAARVVLPVLSSEKVGLLGDRKRLEAIHQHCGDTPVLFVGSFQEPALYRFYTGENAAPLSSVYGRQTQFDLLQFDKDLQGQTVYAIGRLIDTLDIPKKELVCREDTTFYCRKYEHFQGTNRLEVNVDRYRVAGDSMYLDLTVQNHYGVPFDFNHPDFVTTLHVLYKLDHYFPITCPMPDHVVIPAGGCVSFSTHLKYIPDAPFVVCFDNEICRSVNSRPVKLENSKNGKRN